MRRYQLRQRQQEKQRKHFIYNKHNIKIFVCWHDEYKYEFSFVETPRKFIIAKLSIRKLVPSPMLI